MLNLAKLSIRFAERQYQVHLRTRMSHQMVQTLEKGVVHSSPAPELITLSLLT